VLRTQYKTAVYIAYTSGYTREEDVHSITRLLRTRYSAGQ